MAPPPFNAAYSRHHLLAREAVANPYGTFSSCCRAADDAVDNAAGHTTTHADRSAAAAAAAARARVRPYPDASTASWLSRAFFLWFRPLVEITKQRRLQASDIWELPREHRSDAAFQAFAGVFERSGSISRAVLRCCWREIAQSAALSVAGVVVSVAHPLLLYHVIRETMAARHDNVASLAALLVAIFSATVGAVALRCHSSTLLLVAATKSSGAIQTLLFNRAVASVPAPAPALDVSPSFLFHEIIKIHNTIAILHTPWMSVARLVAFMWVLRTIIGGAFVVSIVAALVAQALAIALTAWDTHSSHDWLRAKAARIRVVSECVKTIQSIKLNAWEHRFFARVMALRADEIDANDRHLAVVVVTRVVLSILPEVILTCTFAALVAMRRRPHEPHFDPASAFAIVTIVYRLQGSFMQFIDAIKHFSRAFIVLRRVEAFLSTDAAPRSPLAAVTTPRRWETEPPLSAFAIGAAPLSGPKRLIYDDRVMVHVAGAMLARSADDPLLVNANLLVRRGELVVVYGAVGTGKSTLLHALVGNALLLGPQRAACVDVKGRVAYCSQDPWLQTLSIRDNILFGNAFDEARYVNVLHACGLLRDLRTLPHGDRTIVGPKGINLSGGQKARVCLARACYADADLYLLDTPLCSVDAIVQSDIFSRCLVELLRFKTVVLVTHNMEIVNSPWVDQIVRVEDHQLVHETELGRSFAVDTRLAYVPKRQRQMSFLGARRVRSSDRSTRSTTSQPRSNASSSRRSTDSQPRSQSRKALSASTSTSPPPSPSPSPSGSSVSSSSESLTPPKGLVLLPLAGTKIETSWKQIAVRPREPRSPTTSTSTSTRAAMPPLLLATSELDQVLEPQTIHHYIALCGGAWFVVPLLLLAMLTRVLLITNDVWLWTWSQQSAREMQTAPTHADAVALQAMYLSSMSPWNVVLYGGIVAATAVVKLSGSIVALRGSRRAANALVTGMTRGVLHAPMSFFYTRPIGELINRFSGDVVRVDHKMQALVYWLAAAVAGTLLPYVVLLIVVPEMLIVTPVVALLLYRSHHHLTVALELLRHSVASYSPCYDSIEESVDGRRVLQAFGPSALTRARRHHEAQLDAMLRLRFANDMFQHWEVLQFFKVDVVLLSVLIVVTLRRSLEPVALGLALNYIFVMNAQLFHWYTSALELGANLLIVDRISAYASVPPEDDSAHTGLVLDAWPSRGVVQFQDVSFQYNAAHGPVLRHVSLDIRAGEKIGLVGRTGAGKSSLAMALFRIHELLSGRILIDGVDLARVPLSTLRSRLAIIPQHPLFFQGALRSYLDPFDDWDDVALWTALRKTGLKDVVARMDGKLYAELHENAENLSQGERQLLCLSRVLLKRAKVVVLDEATASIDDRSDEALQRVIHAEMADATILSIAHRLDSVLQLDRVVVMEQGRIVQCGTVEELVTDPNGPFFDLLESTLLQF
ncbi:hypothetical protein PINS_up003769 [Pythium insidiosum]|nr:hypothetical protein PINS_up003769 [Pythium insidiosum]